MKPALVKSEGVSYEPSAAAPVVVAGASRLGSLDVVRGIVMVLMALDHVRVYAGVPAGGPEPAVFFTRWVTNFVAPAFAFFAGTSAFLHGRKLGDLGALAKFLATRGAWLILLELTVIRVAWTFNFDFANYMLGGVIWMLGWCMILLALAIRMPLKVIAVGGAAIVALHNVSDFLGKSGDGGPLGSLLYFGGSLGPVQILYVIIPWIGVMMLGYAFGQVMEWPADRRRGFCIRLGITLTALFVLLRVTNVYGDPRPWNGSSVLGFLSTAKYPASLQFLLMTLGPTLIALGFAERWRGGAAKALGTLGRVPLFYYLLHIPVIHVAACIVSWVREGHVNPWLFANHPMSPPEVPAGYMWSLGLLYLVWALCVVALYFPSRWFAEVRARRRSAWLSYL
jgi:uncharacterized membrane protein